MIATVSARCSTAASRNGVQYYFIDYPPFFDRDALYGTPLGDYHDNAERFALFCRAVMEATKILGIPDIFHCHDWQTALIPILLRTLYQEDPGFAQTRSVFTIHNLGYQGLFPPEVLPLTDAAVGPVQHGQAGVLRQRSIS